jgi:hypothetical protein
VLPFLFNPNAANLQGRVAFIFGATSVLSTVYLYFCHPETKGVSHRRDAGEQEGMNGPLTPRSAVSKSSMSCLSSAYLRANSARMSQTSRSDRALAGPREKTRRRRVCEWRLGWICRVSWSGAAAGRQGERRWLGRAPSQGCRRSKCESIRDLL